MKLNLIIPLFSIFFFTSFDCKEPPVMPPPPVDIVKNTINLTVEWTDLYRIKLKWNKAEDDTLNNFLYNLVRKDKNGNELTRTFYITGKDTSYIDDNDGDSLGIGKAYIYWIKAFNNENELKDTSKTITAATLSPTGHNITWTIDTVGQSGLLYDVWGLNENNVYAIGGVNLDGKVSGVIKWDGITWNLFPSFDGIKQGIFGFGLNEIFVVGEFSNRGVIGIWDGIAWTEYHSEYFLSKGDTVYPLYSVWGSSPNNVWAVGDFGTIIHWDGAEWRKIKDIDERYTLWDVWGFNENSVYAAGNQSNDSMVIYYYNGSMWEKVFMQESPGYRRSTVWGPYEELFYVSDYNQYVFRNKLPSQIFLEGKRSRIFKLRGEGMNNIFTVGDYSEVFHFDGLSWKRMDELYTYPTVSLLFSCEVVNGHFFGVGIINSSALIIRGKINN